MRYTRAMVLSKLTNGLRETDVGFNSSGVYVDGLCTLFIFFIGSVRIILETGDGWPRKRLQEMDISYVVMV